MHNAIFFTFAVRKTYTGKVHGKQDDLIIALQLAAIGSQKFFQDSRYARFRNADSAGAQTCGLRLDTAPGATFDRPFADVGPSRGQFR